MIKVSQLQDIKPYELSKTIDTYLLDNYKGYKLNRA